MLGRYIQLVEYNDSTTTTERATSCSRSSKKWRCAAALSPLLIRSGSKPNWASVSAPSARAGVTTGRATACSPALSIPTARKSRLPTTPSAAAYARHTQELPRTSFGTATCRYTSGRKWPRFPKVPKRKRMVREITTSSPGSLSRARLFLLPNLCLTETASPSYPTTSARPCKPTTRTATRCGSRSWTSTDDSGNAPLRSYRSSTRDNMRIRRRDFIIIGSATTPQGLEHTSAKTQLG